MIIILNLETATTNCSVSVSGDGKLLAIKEHDTPNYSHSEQLHVFIKEVLEEASIEMNELNAVAVSKGPGSYTGLRIGVSAAKGLCFSLDIPLLSIPTLESMAHQTKLEEFDYVIPVLDARRMEVYAVVYDKQGREVKETWAEIVDESSFEAFVKEGNVLVAGSGAEKCINVLTNSNFSFDTAVVPSAREMCQLAFEKYQKDAFEDVTYFEPYYLKDFMVTKKKA